MGETRRQNRELRRYAGNLVPGRAGWQKPRLSGLGSVNLGFRPPKKISTCQCSLVTDFDRPDSRQLPHAESLTHTLEEFLGEASGAVVIEDGAVMFDLAQSKYSISGEHNKCLLHLWSPERNTVRRVFDAEEERHIAPGCAAARPGASD
jgi:hypothetical protein